MLRGQSGTKVISLGAKPSSRGSQDTRPMPEVSTPPQPAGISAPLYIKTQEVHLPVPPKSEDMHSDSTMSPSVTSTKRASLFRLPGGIPVPSPGGYRKSGIPPAEYSTVEFETRLASYSDDDSNGAMESEAVKQRRRESKDDAWVDILVGTQARRMGAQDAILNEGEGRRRVLSVLSSRRSDPDMASLEVAQVLAAVRDKRPLSVVNLNDRVDRDYGVDNLHDHLNDQDVDEIETVPRRSETRTEDDDEEQEEEQEEEQAVVVPFAAEPRLRRSHEDANDESDRPTLAQRISAKHQRRLGYFDLHPERRRPTTDEQNDIDVDPRDRLAYDDSDDDADDEDCYGPPQPPVPTIRKLPAPPDIPRALPAPPIPEPKHHAGPITLPSEPERKPAAPSKTAVLIEMYRERERNIPPKPTGPTPLPPTGPSRLPVRSLPKEGGSLSTPQEQVTASPSPMPPPSPTETTPTELPRIVLEDSGRASPARYVHGAPLHNVVEEEEEE